LSEKFLSPDQNWPNFGGFRGLGLGGTRSFDLLESASFKPFSVTIS